MKSPEKNFEKELQIVAYVLGCMYIKIPDTKMINAGNRYRQREQKRPFDSILITPYGNAAIECKMGTAKLSPHQLDYRERINAINKSHFVFRKKISKKHGVRYSISGYRFPGLDELDLNFRDIRDLIKYVIKWFKEGNNG